MKPGVVVTKDNTRQLAASLAALTGTRVLVGYPSAGSDRQGGGAAGADERTDKDGETAHLNNATIGYLMNTGIPERNVPAREHLATGILAAEEKLNGLMKQTGVAAMNGKLASVERGFTAMGITAQSSIRNVITDGIPPPLADSTLRGRLREHGSRKGEKKELAARAAGAAPSVEFAKPLINTKQLFNAISFVLRKVRGK